MNDIELPDLVLHSISRQDAKYYGSQVKTDDNWHNIKQSVMYEILEEKVKRPLFAQTLRNSMGQELIKTINNEYWAKGKSRKGQNILGQLLMYLRDELHGSQIMSSSRLRIQATSGNQLSCFFALKQVMWPIDTDGKAQLNVIAEVN